MRIGDFLFLHTGKDGGPRSRVDGFWLIRSKRLFTVALLRFAKGSRDAYHSHAFNSVSWLLTGGLCEHTASPHGGEHRHDFPSWRPIVTTRDTFHKVRGLRASSWVLTFRGPWANTWREVDEAGRSVTLTHDRREVA